MTELENTIKEINKFIDQSFFNDSKEEFYLKVQISSVIKDNIELLSNLSMRNKSTIEKYSEEQFNKVQELQSKFGILEGN